MQGITAPGCPPPGCADWRCVRTQEDPAPHVKANTQGSCLCDFNGVARVGGDPPRPLACPAACVAAVQASSLAHAGEPCPGPAKSRLWEELPGLRGPGRAKPLRRGGVSEGAAKSQAQRCPWPSQPAACVEMAQPVLRPAKGCPGPYGPLSCCTDTPNQGKPRASGLLTEWARLPLCCSGTRSGLARFPRPEALPVLFGVGGAPAC